MMLLIPESELILFLYLPVRVDVEAEMVVRRSLALVIIGVPTSSFIIQRSASDGGCATSFMLFFKIMPNHHVFCSIVQAHGREHFSICECKP